MISVLMPVYNGGKYIREAIDSVLMQSFKDFEFIISDDGSKDQTIDIVKEYVDDRIKFINGPRQGQFANHNFLLKRAKGKIIKFMHADDVLKITALAEYTSLFEQHPEVDLIACGMDVIDGDGQDKGTFYRNLGIEKVWAKNELTLLSRRLGDCIGCPPNTIVKRSAINNIFFDESLKSSSDWKWLLNIAETHHVYTTNKRLLKYRIHENSGTSNSVAQNINLFDDLKIINETNNGESRLQIVSAHWRIHLCFLEIIFDAVHQRNTEFAISLIIELIKLDVCLPDYENGNCKTDLEMIMDCLSDGDDSFIHNPKRFKSSLYLFYIFNHVGLTYEFFDGVMSYLSEKNHLNLCLMGYSEEKYHFLKELCQLLPISCACLYNPKDVYIDGDISLIKTLELAYIYEPELYVILDNSLFIEMVANQKMTQYKKIRGNAIRMCEL